MNVRLFTEVMENMPRGTFTKKHLEAAAEAWNTRQQGNATIAARRGGRSLVDVLRTAPRELDALNVRMVVYDTVTDAEELTVLLNRCFGGIRFG